MYILFTKSINDIDSFKKNKKYLILKINENAKEINVYSEGYLSSMYYYDWNAYEYKELSWIGNKAVITNIEYIANGDKIFRTLKMLKNYDAITLVKHIKDITKEMFNRHITCIDNYMEGDNRKMLLNKSQEYIFTSSFNKDDKTIHHYNNRMKGVMKLLTTDGSSVKVLSIFNNNNHFYTNQEPFVFANTRISCGVTQLYKYNELLDTLKYKFDSDIEEYNKYLLKVKHILREYSQGSVVIFSTKKYTMGKYRKFVSDLNKDFSTVTRYSFNNNSNNKIGTTMLIAR